MWICTGFLFVSLENIPFQFFVFHYTQVESDLGLGGFLSFLVATAAAQAGKTPSEHPTQYRHRRPPGRWTSWKNGSEWFPARSGPYQPGPAEGPVWYSSLKNPFWNQSGGMTAASPQAHTGTRCGLAAFLGGGGML